MKCGICGRQLDQPADPLSVDCGGDCWGCIGEIEADMGDRRNLIVVSRACTLDVGSGAVDAAAQGLRFEIARNTISFGLIQHRDESAR